MEGGQFVWTWKGIPSNRYYPLNRAKYKILKAKSTFTIFKEFINDIWNDFRRTSHDGSFR